MLTQWRWGALDMHGVEDIPSLVHKLLATLPGENFQDHMIARRVKKVELGFISSSAQLVGTADKQGFDIVLTFSRKSSVEDWMISIGHELGHTFAYGVELNSSLCRQQSWGVPLSWKWACSHSPEERELKKKSEELEEEFCDQFGVQWATLDGGHPALRTTLQTYLEKPRNEVLNEENGWRHLVFDF